MLLSLLQAPPETPTFGTTVVASSGFRGDVFLIPSNTQRLPILENLQPIGRIYTKTLNVQPREFSAGFPGLTSRFEWFAIDYRANFWIEIPGDYGFSLISDDGSRLYIDDRIVVDNDGIHPPLAQQGVTSLKAGLHSMRVCYFQGPRFLVALVLGVAPPRQPWQIFDSDAFKPPPDSEFWKTTRP